METDPESLLSRVASSIGAGGPTETGKQGKSILSQAASSFARRPSEAESTIPTGFDPLAASLFEAVVEAAFLVANADGEFDATERETFASVVASACHNTVQPAEVQDLVSDLVDQLEEDGVPARVKMVAAAVRTDPHKLEVLRIAALMAYISGGVDDTERDVLDQLAAHFALEGGAVDGAIDQARAALGHA